MINRRYRIASAGQARVWIAFLSIAFVSRAMAQSPADAEIPGEVFLFEGELTRMDNALAPTLREGQVLSGFFTLETAAVAEDEDPTPRNARYSGMLHDGEFIFDVEHVIAYDGYWRDGDAWLTLTRGDGSDEMPADIYGVTLPMAGEAFGEAGWEPRWIQLWLSGEPEKMLLSLDIQPPPQKVGSGWFRVSFWDKATSREATAEGPIKFVGPEGEDLSPTEQIAQLERVVADLSYRLQEAESAAARLSEQLQSAQNRVRGLNNTLDALITERAALQAELERLQATSGEADEALVKRVAELESQQVLLKESKDLLETINEELARSLQRRESELRESRMEIQKLIAEREAAPGEGILDQPVPDSPHPFLAPGQLIQGGMETSRVPVGSASKPVPEPAHSAPPTPVEKRSTETLEEKEEPSEDKDAPSSFRRPRKFHRGGR